MENNKKTIKSLIELLSSGNIDQVNMGLSMIQALAENDITTALLEKTELFNDILILSKDFNKGKSKNKTLANYAILGVLYYAQPENIKANQLKKEITRLEIDLSDLRYLGALPNLTELKLTDSTSDLRNLDGIQFCQNLKSLDISDCQGIIDISAISSLPINNFIFDSCTRIKSFEALEGKADSSEKTELDLGGFGNIENLRGIEFYKNIKKIYLTDNENLKDINSLKNLKNLKEIIHGHLPNLKELKLLITDNCVIKKFYLGSGRRNIGAWSNDMVAYHPNVKILSIRCSDMENLDWLKGFPNLQKLSLHLSNSKKKECLESIEGLKFTPDIICLKLLGDGLKSFSDLNIVNNLHKLRHIELIGCNQITNLDPFLNLKNSVESQNAWSEIYKLEAKEDSYFYSDDEQSRNRIYLNVTDCEKLEDVSGLTHHHRQVNYDESINDRSIGFNGFPSLKITGDLSHVKKINFYNSFNIEVLNSISGYDHLKEIYITQKKVKLEIKSSFQFQTLHIKAEDIEIAGSSASEIIIDGITNPDLTGFKNLENVEVLKLSNGSLRTLQGISACRNLAQLHVENMPDLVSIDDLKACTELKSLTILTCPKLIDTKVLIVLTNLDYLNLSKASQLQVKPTRNIMSYEEIERYKTRLSKHYGITSEVKRVELANEGISKPKEGYTMRDVYKILSLIKSKDKKQVESGIQLTESLRSEFIIDKIFLGIRVENGIIVLNNTFMSNDEQHKKMLQYSFFRIMHIASNNFDKWKNFCESVKECDYQTSIQVCYEMFINIEKLTLNGFAKTEFNINLPSLRQLKIRNLSLNCNHFSGCTGLIKLAIKSCSLENGSGGISSMKELKTFKYHKQNRNDWEEDFGYEDYRTEIDFRKDKEIQNLFDQLGNCVNLEKIDIDFLGNQITSFSSFLQLNKLKSLRLKSIDLIDLHIDTIEDIAACTLLEKLDLTFNSFIPSKLDKLTKLKNLKVIRLRGSFFEQTTFIKKLTFLEEINVRENSIITEFSLPENIDNLKILRLNNLNELKHVYESTNSGELALFSIKNCPKLIDLNFMNGFTKINAWGSDDHLTDEIDGIMRSKRYIFEGYYKMNRDAYDFYTMLEGCTDLEDISGINHLISEFLEVFTYKLPYINDDHKILKLRAQHIKSLDNICHYQGIKELWLHEAKISDINPLLDVSSLEVLDLYGCSDLKKLNGVQNLKNLKTLKLNKSGISDLTFLDELENLDSLYLENCQSIHNLEGLTGHSKLKNIYLKGSNVSDLKNLASVVNLEQLDLENCTHITSLKGLEGLNRLSSLNLKGTANLDNIESLKNKYIKLISIKGSKLKKGDFPDHLQDCVEWRKGPEQNSGGW